MGCLAKMRWNAHKLVSVFHKCFFFFVGGGGVVMSSSGRKKNEEKQIVKSCLQLRYFSGALFSKMKLCCKLEVVYSFSNSTHYNCWSFYAFDN